MRWFRFAVLVLAATILQTSLVGTISVRGIQPNLLLILLVFFSVRIDPRDAIVASFAIGLAADLSNPVADLMGPQIISFGVFGTLLSDVHSIVSIQRISHQVVTIFVVGALTALLSYLLTLFRAEPVTAHFSQQLLWQPLYSAILGPFLFFPVAWWMRIGRKGRKRMRPGLR
ncbi:MAG: rod shape-determining protein MreD [Sedimentisphaerales bacterium]|nr:rod shape-determining protein MreD [Sedimentisphaerales bacterium]